MRPDIFQSLLDIDDALIDWVLCASPDDDDDRAQMRQVLGARSDVEKALNTLVAHRMKLASRDLADDAVELRKVADDLAKVDQDIAAVANVLGLAGQAVDIAAKVIATVITL